MSQAAKNVEYRHIERRGDVCGGSPVISGTRFPVRSVVVCILKQGWTPEELVSQFNHLNLSEVYDALAYYYDHTNDIEEEIRQNSIQ